MQEELAQLLQSADADQWVRKIAGPRFVALEKQQDTVGLVALTPEVISTLTPAPLFSDAVANRVFALGLPIVTQDAFVSCLRQALEESVAPRPIAQVTTWTTECPGNIVADCLDALHICRDAVHLDGSVGILHVARVLSQRRPGVGGYREKRPSHVGVLKRSSTLMPPPHSVAHQGPAVPFAASAEHSPGDRCAMLFGVYLQPCITCGVWQLAETLRRANIVMPSPVGGQAAVAK
mmetsp:Transcript_775/g.1836  ORF Transcript_775/g.1836 Transcript_775/m.1836 type:complete len:235 (+) Transcript_775:55-759(+)